MAGSYNQGWNAYVAGRSMSACPHEDGTEAFFTWRQGWIAACNDSDARQGELDEEGDEEC